MKTYRSLCDAYWHFMPVDERRVSETVVIFDGDIEKIRFLHWDVGSGEFCLERRTSRRYFDAAALYKRAHDASYDETRDRSKRSYAEDTACSFG